MFRRSIMLTLSLAAILSGCAKDKNELAQDLEKQKTRGAEIVAQYQKQESHPSQHVQLRMSITSPAESEKVYEFEIWRKRDQNQSKSLLRVVKPDSEKGFVSLSTQSNDAEPVSVSYNPLSQQFAESRSTDQAFGGLTIQEMLGDWSKYQSRLVSENTANGIKMYEIENTLKPGESSTIKRFRVLIRQDTMLPSEAHVFDAQDSEIRTYRITEYRTADTHPVFWQIEIDNPVRKTRINLEVINETFNEKLDDAMFTRENLKKLARVD